MYVLRNKIKQDGAGSTGVAGEDIVAFVKRAQKRA